MRTVGPDQGPNHLHSVSAQHNGSVGRMLEWGLQHNASLSLTAGGVLQQDTLSAA